MPEFSMFKSENGNGSETSTNDFINQFERQMLNFRNKKSLEEYQAILTEISEICSRELQSVESIEVVRKIKEMSLKSYGEYPELNLLISTIVEQEFINSSEDSWLSCQSTISFGDFYFIRTLEGTAGELKCSASIEHIHTSFQCKLLTDSDGKYGIADITYEEKPQLEQFYEELKFQKVSKSQFLEFVIFMFTDVMDMITSHYGLEY